MKRLATLVVLGLAFASLHGLPASASTFKTCKTLQAVYVNGVAQSKSWKNKGRGPIFSPRVSSATYSANKRLDLDKDGIICERIKPAKPSTAPNEADAGPSQSSSVLALRLRSTSSSNSSSLPKLIYVSEVADLSYGNRFIIEAFERHLRWLTGSGAGLRNDLVVIIPRTAVWMADQIAKQGCGAYSLPLGGYAIWADCNGRSVITRPDLDTERANWASLEAQSGLIHEAWHQWQRETVGTSLGNSDYPKWIWEGSAHAISRYAYWSVGDQIQDPADMLNSWFLFERPDLRSACVGVTIREMVPNAPWPDKANCAYSKGQVAIDLFVEKFGFSALISIFKAPKQSGMKDFAAIFKTVTGVDLEQFYDEVDLEMAKRGWR